MYSFGQVIPVTGPNVGFPGAVSRIGERVIAARQVNENSTLNLHFGEAAVLIPDSEGGTWRSVKDYITAGGIANIAAYFAGIAVREVKTMLTYPNGITPGALQQVGYYAPGEIGEVLERGSITVNLTNGTPVAGGQVYLRTIANGSLPLSPVGGLEAASDGGNSIALTGVVFRTGLLDANNVVEITIKERLAA